MARMREDAGLEPAPYPMADDTAAAAMGVEDKLDDIDDKLDEREK